MKKIFPNKFFLFFWKTKYKTTRFICHYYCNNIVKMVNFKIKGTFNEKDVLKFLDYNVFLIIKGDYAYKK